jgi:cardiolipin synthase
MLWKSETIIFDGDDYFRSLFEAWSRAERTIDFETYIFDDDEIGQDVTHELLKAQARGVRVRLLVDGIGASGWWQTRGVELQKQGLEVRVFSPLRIPELWRRLMIDLRMIVPEKKPKKSLVLRRLNRRNHRKVSVIDGHVAFVGSINVSKTHSFQYSGKVAWRDIAVRLEGPGVSDLISAFHHAWSRSYAVSEKRRLKIRFSFRRRDGDLTSPVSLNYTGRLRRMSRGKFKTLLNQAKNRIWISNAYLAPPSNITRVLTKAARRGVDVRVLVPSQSDVWFMPFIARAYYRPLLKAGVRVFEYKPRFLHAKSLIVDDEAVIGTSNLNRRSFLHDLEVDVRLDAEQTLEKLSSSYLTDLESSEEIFNRGTIVGSRLGRLLNYFIRYWV